MAAIDLSKLPEFYAMYHPETNEPVLIERGKKGYCPAPHIVPEQFNKTLGVTPAQAKAMEFGSHAGFHVPGADPEVWEQKLAEQGLA